LQQFWQKEKEHRKCAERAHIVDTANMLKSMVATYVEQTDVIRKKELKNFMRQSIR
jgi:hypothetical protein